MLKKCKQCGTIKDESAFRKYYGGRQGTYKTCKACEKINQHYKYLRSIKRSMDQERELDAIEQLYEVQRKHGLNPPGPAKSHAEEYEEMAKSYKKSVPADLIYWLELTIDKMDKDPEFYDSMYGKLRDKYMPIVGLDGTGKPIYDVTYKPELDQILDKFFKYEDMKDGT